MACTDQERELILQLLDDLHLLEKRVAYDLPSPADLRATFSPIMRRWIVDGEFFRIRRLLDKHVLFDLPSRTDDVKRCQAGVYTWWMGDIHIGNGATVGASQLAQKYVDSPSLVSERRKPFRILQKGKLFFEQPCFFWKEKMYTRADAIKFLANKLGGAHYNWDRQKTESHVGEIQNQFGIVFEGLANARMLAPGELLPLRADPNARDKVFDAIQLTVGDTASIFRSGIRSHENEIRELLN